ncbi:nitroreductase family protein [Bradymonas sediminis]|nr:nitroreductase [Bradymonas sediminis]TDP73588.1 nitroreductase [Bradymonas sediminis]
MNTREAILTRRTVQKFSTDPVPEGCVERAVECALRAPNHKLTNPWRFRRAGPETREKLLNIVLDIKRADAAAKGRELKQQSIDMIQAKAGNSPELLVVTQIRNDEDAFRSREDYAAIACAIQNISLSLWSEGVGSKWATGGPTRHPDTYKLLGIDPASEEIVGFVRIGHPMVEPMESPRLPLKDVYSELP